MYKNTTQYVFDTNMYKNTTQYVFDTNMYKNTTQYVFDTNMYKSTTQYVFDTNMYKNTNNVNKTWAFLQTTGGKDQTNIVFMQKSAPTSHHGTQNVKTHNRTMQNK
jgi:ribosomal protein L14E/L6E/L27E